MNRAEKKILHGLYFYTRIVGQEMPAKTNEIRWFAVNRFKAGRNWRDSNNQLQTAEPEGGNYLAAHGRARVEVEQALSYLRAAGFIEYRRNGDDYRYSVTVTGADRARKLDGWFGRIDVAVRDGKDGLLQWLLLVITSSLAASFVAHALDRKVEAPDKKTEVSADSTYPAGHPIPPF
jgi:hypothetical protein